jgi:hypothetical protein
MARNFRLDEMQRPVMALPEASLASVADKEPTLVAKENIRRVMRSLDLADFGSRHLRSNPSTA